jgi:hypothetical protein
MRRLVVLAAALLFITGFAFLTLSAVSKEGFSLASIIAIFILVLLAVGVVGALISPPR